MGSAEKYFFKDLLLDRQDLWSRWVMCFVEGKKVSATPVKFTHEWEAASSTHKSRTTADHNSEMTITQNRECDLLWTIRNLNQNWESDPH